MSNQILSTPLGRRDALRLAGIGALALGGVPLLSACGAGDGSSASAITKPDLAKAKEEGKVTFYTSVDTKALEAMNAAFTKKYGIKVEYFRGDSQDAITRLLNEAKARSVKADVIETSDSTGILYLKDQKITRPYASAELANFPGKFKDKDHYWTYTRLTLGVVTYNTKKITQAPASWRELASSPYGDTLAFFSDAQGSGAARLWTLAQSLGWDTIEAWGAKKPLRVESPQLLRQTIERGERSVGIAQNDNHALSSKQDSGTTDFVIPQEGAPVEPAAISVVADAPHPNAALLYHDFWLSQEGMQILVDVGKKYVARTGMSHPKGAKPLSDITLIEPDYAKYVQERTETLSRLQKIFGGEWGQ